MKTLSERRPKKSTDMGRFSVEIEVANNFDVMDVQRGRIKPDQVRRVKLPGVVDSGATRLVLPGRSSSNSGCLLVKR
jgi:hypothetical protein